MATTVNIFWFRRDLRLEDNAGLYHALKGSHPGLTLFIFDRIILDDLENKTDRRVEFIYSQLEALQVQLCHVRAAVLVRYGIPADGFSLRMEE